MIYVPMPASFSLPASLPTIQRQQTDDEFKSKVAELERQQRVAHAARRGLDNATITPQQR
jgi:hypothetical protein